MISPNIQDILALLTNELALQATSEDLVDNAVAFASFFAADVHLNAGHRLGAMLMEQVKRCHEEFMRILLLVASQMFRVCPDQM